MLECLTWHIKKMIELKMSNEKRLFLILFFFYASLLCVCV